MHQVLLLDVKLQVNVGTEAFPAMKAEERSLTGMGYQMMLQTNRNLTEIKLFSKKYFTDVLLP